MNVVRLADVAEGVQYDTADDALFRAVAIAKEGHEDHPNFRATGAVILLLDEREGGYTLLRVVSNLKTSEIVAALEVGKAQELNLFLRGI